MGSKYSFLSEILREDSELLEEMEMHVKKVLFKEDDVPFEGEELHAEKPLEKSNLFKFSRESGKIIGMDLNVFSVVLANQLMNGRGYTICSSAELHEAVKGKRISFEGKIVDAGLVLSGEASPNEGQSRAFAREIRERKGIDKLKKLNYPFVIPLSSLEVFRDEKGSKFDGILFKIREGAKIIDASQSTLQYPHGQYHNVGYFDETDGNGLPKVNGTGWRKLENRLGGTLRLCLIDGRDFKTMGDFVSYNPKLDAVFRYQR